MADDGLNFGTTGGAGPDDGLDFGGFPQPPSVPPDPTGEEWRGPPGPQGQPGQPGPPGAGGPFLPLTGGTMSGPLNYTATGGTAVRSAQDRAQSMALTVEDFGAKGDGIADDTAAFNALAAYLRNRAATNGYFTYTQFTLGAARLYRLSGSVNLTEMNYTTFEGNGSAIIGSPAVAGTVTLDALQCDFISFQNFTFIAEGPACKYGIQLGRATAAGLGASQTLIQNVLMTGSFGVAAIYNRASESSNFVNLNIIQRYSAPNAYAIIMDGDCSFPITSQFAATYNPSNPTVQDGQAPGTLQSFNQQTFIGCTLSSDYGPGVWMSGLRGHKYVNSYVIGAASGPAAILSFAHGGSIDDLWWDVHCEHPTLTAIFRIVGTGALPVMRTLYIRDYYVEPTASIFAVDAAVTSVIIHDLEMHIQHTLTNIPVFDVPAKYTVLGGRIYVGPGITFNVPIGQGTINSNGVFSAIPISDAAQTLTANGQTIVVPSGASAVKITNTTGNLTGLILQQGYVGQVLTILNIAGFSIAFAGAGTSNVVTSPPIAAFGSKQYVMSSNTQWWPT
jgi:hypothetical protein